MEGMLTAETLRDGHREAFTRFGISELDEHRLSLRSQQHGTQDGNKRKVTPRKLQTS